jgi:hypothetical protein
MVTDDGSSGGLVVVPQPHGGALTPFQPGQSGNPAGKPKGTKHISTWIQELLHDEEFTLDNFNFGGKQFKGAPIKAITTVAVMQALQGDEKWANWLAKYGYSEKKTVEHTGTIKHVPILGGASVHSNDSDTQVAETTESD